jgi:hypothetical protein
MEDIWHHSSILVVTVRMDNLILSSRRRVSSDVRDLFDIGWNLAHTPIAIR